MKDKLQIKEELEDNIKSLEGKILRFQNNLNKMYEKYRELKLKYLMLDPNYVKIECLNCGGKGYLLDENNTKKICTLCNGEGFIFAKKWKE